MVAHVLKDESGDVCFEVWNPKVCTVSGNTIVNISLKMTEF